MTMPESANRDMVVALCRFRGGKNDRLSERCENHELRTVGAVFDHAENDFVKDFILWLLRLAREDLDRAVKREAQRPEAEK